MRSAFSPVMSLWAGQLSTTRAIFRPWLDILLSSFRTHSVNISLVIQARLLALYATGSVFTFLKHRGALLFPPEYQEGERFRTCHVGTHHYTESFFIYFVSVALNTFVLQCAVWHGPIE